ncbi:hypothetical protein BpHYR1_024353 [Brachionus plicatilis]|uniref:Uncharacterized protein n=1 Tax=Brachionus plicatilis TaxID=10195 RepID=A0A3M7QBV8_BRAPC|nr:hypothetical protein BpHYR1_024353 [Brachionus plicatilis]
MSCLDRAQIGCVAKLSCRKNPITLFVPSLFVFSSWLDFIDLTKNRLDYLGNRATRNCTNQTKTQIQHTSKSLF